MKTTSVVVPRAKSALPMILLTLLGTAAAGCSEDDPGTGNEPLGPSSSSTSTQTSPMNTPPPATTSAPGPAATPTMTMTAPRPTPTQTMMPPMPTPTQTMMPPMPTAEPTETAPTTEPTDSGAGGGGGGAMMGTGGGAGDPGMPMGGAGGSDEPGNTAEPAPSDGCGNANPNTGSSGAPLNVSGHNYYVKLPNGYDPNTPYKVMIVFPPTGNPITWSEQSAGYEQAAPDAIRVYTHMANEGSGWQPNETSFFQGLYDNITQDYCVDKNRIFAGGESSGGEFAGFIGCEYGDIVRGVVPTAAKMTSWQIDLGAHDCKGNPTAVVIWSERDSVLNQPAGAEFRDFYRDMNMCEQTSTPVEGWTDDLSNCQKFDGCIAGSDTYYCMHNDPEYGNTYHGWPHFAAEMTWEVFSAL